MSHTGQRGSAAVVGSESERDEAERKRSCAVAGEMLEVEGPHEGARETEVGRQTDGEAASDEAQRNRSGAVASEMLEVERSLKGAREMEVERQTAGETARNGACGWLRRSSRREKAGRTMDNDE